MCVGRCWAPLAYAARHADETYLPEVPTAQVSANGWWVQTEFNRRVEWHRGNAPGLVSQIARYPKERLFTGGAIRNEGGVAPWMRAKR